VYSQCECDVNRNQHLPVFVSTGEADLGQDEGGRPGTVANDGGVSRPDDDERGAGATSEATVACLDVELHPATHPERVPLPSRRPGLPRRRRGESDQGNHDRRLRR